MITTTFSYHLSSRRESRKREEEEEGFLLDLSSQHRVTRHTALDIGTAINFGTDGWCGCVQRWTRQRWAEYANIRAEIVCTAARKLEGSALVVWRGSPDQTNGESGGGRRVNYMWRRLPVRLKILFGETRVCAPYCDAFPRGQNVTGFRRWFNRRADPPGWISSSRVGKWNFYANSVILYLLVIVRVCIYIYLYGIFVHDLSRQNLNSYIIMEFVEYRINFDTNERDVLPSFMLVALIREDASRIQW